MGINQIFVISTTLSLIAFINVEKYSAESSTQPFDISIFLLFETIPEFRMYARVLNRLVSLNLLVKAVYSVID